MQVEITALNNIKYTSNGIAFDLSVKYGADSNTTHVVYFGNVEKDDSTIDKTTPINKCCFKSGDDVYHNMYASTDLQYHGLAARMHNYPYEKEPDYQHIYKCNRDNDNNVLNNNMLNVIQSKNTFYAIDGLSTVGHSYPNAELYDYLCRDNQYAFPYLHSIDTYLYDKSRLSDDLPQAVSAVMHGVKYNTIYEIPGNIQQDYHSGSILATTVKAKNQYNAIYDMCHDATNILKNARSYSEICNCNDQIYLKYKDNVSYNKEEGSEITSVQDVTHYNVSVDTAKTTPTVKLPQIEVLENINRGINTNNHKSTLYTIDVKNTKIFNDDVWSNVADNQNIKDNLKREIKNNIRAIAESLAPANTQLFAVTIS